VLGGDVAHSSPELADTITSKPVEDPIALAARAQQSGTGQQPQMLGRVRGALPNLRRDLVDGALPLRENVDNLCPTTTPQRRRDRRERVEQRALRRLITHKFNLILEYLDVKLARRRSANSLEYPRKWPGGARPPCGDDPELASYLRIEVRELATRFGAPTAA
jgi:hypothetical protein